MKVITVSDSPSTPNQVRGVFNLRKIPGIEFIHAQIVKERDAGAAVLIVSTELNEVTALADRIAVMYRGRFIGIVPPDTPRNALGLMMAGVSVEEALAAVEHDENQPQVNDDRAEGVDHE